MPRVKVVLARAARLVADGAPARRAERTAVLRRREVDMMGVCAANDLIDLVNTIKWHEPLRVCPVI